MGLLSLAACLLTTQASVADELSVDLFLVANNGSLIHNLDWMEKPGGEEAIEQLLRPSLSALDAQKKSFILIDGGQCSAFNYEREGKVIVRKYSGYDSALQTLMVKGKPKTQVLARTESVETSTSGTTARSQRPSGYIMATFIHFDLPNDGKMTLAVQDLNSLQNVRKRPAPEKELSGSTLLLSNDSIQSTKATLAQEKDGLNGIAICPWGLPDPSAPNLISFPPAGVVSHYQLQWKDGKWSVRLVGYLRASAS